MASYTWEYGSAGSGLHFTIEYNIEDGTFTVHSLEGKFDLNALWWDDGTDDNVDVALSKSDSSLNMNGSGAEDWDGVAKLSSAGLGAEGEDKESFISDGETAVFTLADFGITGDFNPEEGGTLGVRATSVNGGDSIKLVDTDPEYEDDEPDDHFPEWDAPSISHVTFYFNTGTDPYYGDDTVGDTTDDPDTKGSDNNPDGWFTVKFDDNADLSDDLDDWFDDAMTQIAADYPDLDLKTLAGVSIKGGSGDGSEIWYDLDNDPLDDDSANAPDVWIVENKEVDVSYSVIEDDPFTVAV